MTMATSTAAPCFVCEQGKITYKCVGCSKTFCCTHLTEHHNKLNEQIDEIENDRNLFVNEFNQQKQNRQDHFLIKQIDQWEKNSIMKIKQTAEECRQHFSKYMKKYSRQIDNQLRHLTEQFKEIRNKKTFDEYYFSQLKQKLIQLREELHKPRNIFIEETSTLFIDKITLIDRSNIKWKEYGIDIVRGNELGNPTDIFIDDDRTTIYIADPQNDRIIRWKSNENNGTIVAGGNGKGKQMNQLNCPINIIFDQETDSLIISDYGNKRIMQWFCHQQHNGNGQMIISNIHCYGVTMDRNGFIYVSDYEKHEVRKWKIGDRTGKLVAGGNGKGSELNQLNHPTFLFIDKDWTLYISDCANHRVMKWFKDAKEGIIVAGGNGEGSNLKQLSGPSGVIVDQFNQIYVADCGNNRVMRWFEGATKGNIVIGGNGCGKESNQLFYPMGLSFDQEGNVYVVDSVNKRIEKFEMDFN